MAYLAPEVLKRLPAPSPAHAGTVIASLIAQRDSDMICVYVAVGQKTSSVRRAIDALQAHGNFARCIVIVAGSASAPGLQWIAPYALERIPVLWAS